MVQHIRSLHPHIHWVSLCSRQRGECVESLSLSGSCSIGARTDNGWTATENQCLNRLMLFVEIARLGVDSGKLWSHRQTGNQSSPFMTRSGRATCRWHSDSTHMAIGSTRSM